MVAPDCRVCRERSNNRPGHMKNDGLDPERYEDSDGYRIICKECLEDIETIKERQGQKTIRVNIEDL